MPSRFKAKLALIGSLALIIHAAPAWSATMARQIVSDVRIDIARGDCKAAAETLDKGITANYPEVELLAGSMYESGVCLKRDWERAVRFYSLAFKSGQRPAAYRLIAGFAAPENGPDAASALWWASRVGVLNGCVPTAPNRDNPDLFLAEVKTWTGQRIASCNYLAGVMATIAGEVQYPVQPLHWSIGGDVQITFRPALPRIELTLNGTEQYLLSGVYSGDKLWEQNDKKLGSEFVQTVRAVADRALKRYPKPDNIPADIPDQKLLMRFQIEDARMPHFSD
jgi:TPR repeat protein